MVTTTPAPRAGTCRQNLAMTVGHTRGAEPTAGLASRPNPVCRVRALGAASCRASQADCLFGPRSPLLLPAPHVGARVPVPIRACCGRWLGPAREVREALHPLHEAHCAAVPVDRS
jgi:hypothetical protein